MKERENDQTHVAGRNRCQHGRVRNSDFGCRWLCWLATNCAEKSRGKTDALRPREVSSDSHRKYLGEQGSVTAEFAIVLPGVMVILFFALSVLAMQTSRVGLVELAAEGARALARGESEAIVEQLIEGVGLGSQIASKTSYSDLSVCLELVQLKEIPPFGREFAIELKEIQCARKGGL